MDERLWFGDLVLTFLNVVHQFQGPFDQRFYLNNNLTPEDDSYLMKPMPFLFKVFVRQISHNALQITENGNNQISTTTRLQRKASTEATRRMNERKTSQWHNAGQLLPNDNVFVFARCFHDRDMSH